MPRDDASVPTLSGIGRPSFREELPIPERAQGIIWLHQGNHVDHPRHRHEAVELNLVVAGRSHYEVDGRRIPLGPGSVLWIYPDQDHQQAERTPDFEMWIVALQRRLLETICPEGSPLLDRRPRGDQCRALPWEDVTWLDRELERLAARDSSAVLNAGLAYCALGSWEAFNEARPGVPLIRPEVHAAMTLLDADPRLSREELAERLDVCPTHLSRAFGEDLQLTLTEYRTRVRLERFAELITNHRHTYLDAALRAGFGSYAQCHRAFVAHMGCGPREYVQRMRPERTRAR